MISNQPQVINLSPRSLNIHEINVLTKGLSFIPKPKFHKFDWIKDVNLFTRKIALHKFHSLQMEKTAKRYDLAPSDMECLNTLIALLEENGDDTGNTGYTNLRPKSTFTPHIGEYSNIETFCTLVCQEIEKLDEHSVNASVPHNITKIELQALKNLGDDKEIVIKKADKGGNIVVLSIEQYRKMVLTILEDSTTYSVLTCNPTMRFSSELMSILTDARGSGVITDKEYDFMKPISPMLATFYALPKIHKKIQPSPGRPIVSGCMNLTQNSSIYIEKILQTLVCQLPSYVRDSKQMLNFLSNCNISNDTLLCSLDVESLYSCIPHDLGLKHVKYYLDTRGEAHSKHTEFVLQLLQFVLTHNFFIFDRTFYRQVTGTAMGTAMAHPMHICIWDGGNNLLLMART
uniref:Reverse transcriptase domain-containing protein n=1 Tax=Leptobrachium leishanense TaxID=445787 RepID=A0A8C5QQL5_9ANUR